MAPALKDTESRFIVERLPEQYLQIFRKKPYVDLNWATLFNSRRPEGANRPSASRIAACPDVFLN
jgi:hypothetical protein